MVFQVTSPNQGPSGKRQQTGGATREDFFASVLKSNEMSNSRDPSRALRQSRVSREIVSSSQGVLDCLQPLDDIG